MPRRRADRERREKHAAAADRAERPRLERTPAERAALVLWGALAALALARVVAPLLPGTWAWSLGLHRFLDPIAARAPWLLAAAALVPGIAGRLEPLLARLGDAIARRPAIAMPVAAVLAAALVGLLPDRVHFVGDFVTRETTLAGTHASSAALYPQAMPLDLLLHDRLPRALMAALGLDANGAGRLIGALDAALMAVLSLAFARALALGGSAAAAAAAVVFWGGELTLFTGYDKGFAEMALAAAWAGASALRLVREGRGALALGLALATALALHRSGAGLLPGAALAWWLWLRAGGASELKKPGALAGLALPLVTLAVLARRALSIAGGFDAVNFAPEDVRRAGLLRAALEPLRLVDLVNLALMLSPLALATPALALVRGREPDGFRARLVLLTLALPWLGMAFLLHPQQGLVRDWDVFVPVWVAVSLLAAFEVAEILRAAPRYTWLAATVALGVAAPASQWLLHHAEATRGLARVEALLQGPPERSETDRASGWDFLGVRRLELDRAGEAADAFRRSAEIAPRPRVLREWATAEALNGDLAAAIDIYHVLLDRSPQDAAAWSELAMLAMRAGRRDEARAAAERLLALRPGHPLALRILQDLGSAPPAGPR